MTIPTRTYLVEGRKIDLVELERVAEAATPGPWERTDGCECSVSESGDEAFWSWEQAGPAQVHGTGNQPVADADFIATVTPDVVLALISEIQGLRVEAERYRWLRDKSESGHSFYLSVPLWLSGIRFRKEDVDAGIDNAMGNGDQS